MICWGVERDIDGMLDHGVDEWGGGGDVIGGGSELGSDIAARESEMMETSGESEESEESEWETTSTSMSESESE